jgi:hypothetical protein
MDIIKENIVMILVILFGVASSAYNWFEESAKKKKNTERKAREKEESRARMAKAAEEEKIKIRKEKNAEDKKLLEHMPSKLSELTPIVSEVVNGYDFSECLESIQLVDLSDGEIILREYSERLKLDYRRGISAYIRSSHSDFPFNEEVVRDNYNVLLDKAEDIGARAIAKKIGFNFVGDEQNRLDRTDRQSLRKTKKWED